MFLVFSLFLAFIVPGFIAMLIYEIVRRRRIREGYRFLAGAFIFDLVIAIISLVGLYVFKNIFTVETLMVYFNCLSFTPKYLILASIEAIILGIIAGLIFRAPLFWRTVETERQKQ